VANNAVKEVSSAAKEVGAKSVIQAVAKRNTLNATPTATYSIPKLYVVRTGDSLWKIARTFQVDVEKIKSYNALQNDRPNRGKAQSAEPLAPIDAEGGYAKQDGQQTNAFGNHAVGMLELHASNHRRNFVDRSEGGRPVGNRETCIFAGDECLGDETIEIIFVQYGRNRLLDKGSVEQWRRLGEDWRNEPLGEPLAWAHYGSNFVIRPAPNALAVSAAPNLTVRRKDTPPSIAPTIAGVVAVAQLVVIPVRPSPNDLRAVGSTVDVAVAGRKPMVFVVNGATLIAIPKPSTTIAGKNPVQ